MQQKFYKFQASGNDFIIIDDRINKFPLSSDLITFLCHRNFGIGADGLILLQNHKNHDFEMLFFNPDGSSGSMCGNGGRCIALFAFLQSITVDKMKFTAPDGSHEARILKNQFGQYEVELSMNDVAKIQKLTSDYFLNTGAPHLVKFVKNIDDLPIIEQAKEIRYSPDFKPMGTNVNFVEAFDQHLYVRTYEKGVEAETLSCGTGVTASAIAFAERESLQKGKIDIISKGGALSVLFEKKDHIYTNIHLNGPAELVFAGSIEL